MTTVKPDYCIHPEEECAECSFYWPKEAICSLMPDEELKSAWLREKRKAFKEE